MSDSYYNNTRFVRNIYKQVKQSDVIEFFESLGLMTYEDEEGRIYLDKIDVVNVFVYDALTFKKLEILAKDLKKGIIIIDKPYCNVEVDY
jgi:predicted flavoprotein YhiN